ncbi:hypothetical protein CFC21_027578 [Triticum aestivum]|uniref:Uncharacterized protein n=2 Tax=Triticum aestivum TaxID=4565 RepID=A0A9R1EMU0_WHEAT|nr:hypothetical protein CFC21_027578 [Triticum aestivum]
MAPSKSHLASLFLAVVLIAAMPETSAAAVTARAPAPSTNSDLVAKPSSWSWCIIPCFSFIPEIFCIPPIFCPRPPPPPPRPPPPPSPSNHSRRSAGRR